MSQVCASNAVACVTAASTQWLVVLVQAGTTSHVRAVLLPLCCVAGYLQERAGAGAPLTLPQGLTSVNVTVTPPFKPGAGERLTLPAKLNASYGSLHLVVPVPADATPSNYMLALRMPKTRSPPKGRPWEDAEVTSLSFTVGNPRPPTALLNVTAPSWVRGLQRCC